jgi:Ca2+-binding RTX toxin-like protein
MKKFLLLALTAVLVAQVPARADTNDSPVNVLIAGGEARNKITIRLTGDGHYYVIDSIVPLEVGGTVCANPPDVSTKLLCRAPMIASFEFNAGDGNDRMAIGRSVTIPVLARGGPGNDHFLGGGGEDKMLGGSGNDRLFGRGGNDTLFGGNGRDRVVGGPGDDVLRGGRGFDFLAPGPGRDRVRQ